MTAKSDKLTRLTTARYACTPSVTQTDTRAHPWSHKQIHMHTFGQADRCACTLLVTQADSCAHPWSRRDIHLHTLGHTDRYACTPLVTQSDMHAHFWSGRQISMHTLCHANRYACTPLVTQTDPHGVSWPPPRFLRAKIRRVQAGLVSRGEWREEWYSAHWYFLHQEIIHATNLCIIVSFQTRSNAHPLALFT